MTTVSSKTNKLISIGIDVGSVNGAISIVSEDGEILLLTKTPTYSTEVKSKRNKSKINVETGKYEADFRKRNWVDFTKLREIFEPYIKFRKIYTIEKMAPRSNEGTVAPFINGNSLGIFQGLYAYLVPELYLEPKPAEWKHELNLSAVKEESIKLAEEIYKVKLKNYLPKGKVDDIAEALLLAFYGFKKYYEINERKRDNGKK